MAAFEKIVVITQKTALEELVERYNTRAQAKFYLEHVGTSFESYQAAHDAYTAALEGLKQSLPGSVRTQFVERSFLPNFLFGESDLVVTLGRDGLVVNTAKYLASQPLLALNPDPRRIDGVLAVYPSESAGKVLSEVLRGDYSTRRITMAQASLDNGQVLFGVNDLFIGQRTHLSARYRLQLGRLHEDQSSSGIIVSTGAGSTGWLRSILTGAAAVVEAFAGKKGKGASDVRDRYRFDWDADYLCFSVREPFISKTSGAQLAFGRIEAGEELIITSQMPQQGVIFSDGIEADYLEFNSGRIARIGVADRQVQLIAPRNER